MAEGRLVGYETNAYRIYDIHKWKVYSSRNFPSLLNLQIPISAFEHTDMNSNPFYVRMLDFSFDEVCFMIDSWVEGANHSCVVLEDGSEWAHYGHTSNILGYLGYESYKAYRGWRGAHDGSDNWWSQYGLDNWWVRL